MKKVLVLSIQHTGTFFTSRTIAASYPNSHLRVGSLYEKHRNMNHERYVEKGPIELSDFYPPSKFVPKDYIDKTVIPVCTPEELKDKDLVIGHEHFHKPDSWILRALKGKPAECPIVIPVRDPILSLHSKIWREIEQHNNPAGKKEKARRKRLERWIALYKDILNIPNKNVFHFPIDAFSSQSEETRIQQVKDLYEYCGLTFNENALQAAQEWIPANKTYRLIEVEKKKKPSNRWENFKQKYAQRDVKHARDIMGLEFEALHKEKHLIELMKRVGYKDVLWW